MGQHLHKNIAAFMYLWTCSTIAKTQSTATLHRHISLMYLWTCSTIATTQSTATLHPHTSPVNPVHCQNPAHCLPEWCPLCLHQCLYRRQTRHNFISPQVRSTRNTDTPTKINLINHICKDQICTLVPQKVCQNQWGHYDNKRIWTAWQKHYQYFQYLLWFFFKLVRLDMFWYN